MEQVQNEEHHQREPQQLTDKMSHNVASYVKLNKASVDVYYVDKIHENIYISNRF